MSYGSRPCFFTVNLKKNFTISSTLIGYCKEYVYLRRVLKVWNKINEVCDDPIEQRQHTLQRSLHHYIACTRIFVIEIFFLSQIFGQGTWFISCSSNTVNILFTFDVVTTQGYVDRQGSREIILLFRVFLLILAMLHQIYPLHD